MPRHDSAIGLPFARRLDDVQAVGQPIGQLVDGQGDPHLLVRIVRVFGQSEATGRPEESQRKQTHLSILGKNLVQEVYEAGPIRQDARHGPRVVIASKTRLDRGTLGSTPGGEGVFRPCGAVVRQAIPP